MLERAIDIYEATRAWPFRALLIVHRGTACMLAGRLDSALALGQKALTLAREHGERGHEASALRLLGDIASQTGPREAEQAERYYREAGASANELGMRPLLAHCHLGLGRLYRRTGRRDQAQEQLTTAKTMYHEMGMMYWLEQAEAEMKDVAR